MSHATHVVTRIPGLRSAPTWVFTLLPGSLLYVTLYLPAIVVILVLSFQTYVPGRLLSPPLTIANYLRFLTDSYYAGLLLTTLFLSAVASMLTVLIAYPLAYAVVRSARLRRIILPILVVSFFVPSIVQLYGWIGLLARGGLLNRILLESELISRPISFLFTPTAVVIALSSFALPYAALILISTINRLDESLEEASQNLGATLWQTLVRVTVPLTFPGVVAALLVVFALSVSAVLVPVVLGGGRVPMLGSQIYASMTTALNYPFASASILILVVAVFASTSAVGRTLSSGVPR